MITLEEITEDTLNDILDLVVAENQVKSVAPNAVSIAQAHFSHNAWFRAIYVDAVPVGFVMLFLDASKPEYIIKRFMIDHKHQGKGYGTAALEQIIDFVTSLPEAYELLLSYLPEENNPSGFFAKHGFVDTDETMDGERVMRKPLE